jgi:spermidine synthase
MGGGSVIKTLRNDFNYIKTITAVEIDPVIINVANTEFHIIENKNLKIHCVDAHDFVKANTTLFDLIIVDLYIDLNVPEQFLSIDFWEGVLSSKSSKGSILFNASVGKTESDSNLDNIISFLRSKVFKVSVFENVNNTNTIIIASGL